jgi:ribulose bisphosphate carboxylase small subunit
VTEIIKLDNRKGFVEDIRHTLNCLRTSQEQYFRLRRVIEDEQKKTEILSFIISRWKRNVKSLA